MLGGLRHDLLLLRAKGWRRCLDGLDHYRIHLFDVISFGERDAWSLRVSRKIPRSYLLRPIAFLFYSGSAGGMLWCALIFAATAIITITSNGYWMPHNGELYRNLRHDFQLCLVLLPDDRCATSGSIPEAANTQPTRHCCLSWNSGEYSCRTGCFFLSRNPDPSCPVPRRKSSDLGHIRRRANDMAKFVVVIWLVVSLILSAPWAIGQWRRFKPFRINLRRRDFDDEPALCIVTMADDCMNPVAPCVIPPSGPKPLGRRCVDAIRGPEPLRDWRLSYARLRYPK